MSLMFDSIIIVVAVICVLSGFMKGFIKSVMGFAGGIASLLAAYAFTPRFAPIAAEKYLLEPITDGLRETILSLLMKDGEFFNIAKLFEDMPDAFTQILNRYGADEASLQSVFGNAAAANADAVDTLAKTIAEPVAGALASVIIFLIIFTLCSIAITLITWILDLIFHLPALKSANSLLGGVFGLLCALLLSWIISLVSINFIRAMIPIYPETFNETIISNSVLLKYFSENNLVAVAGEALLR